MKCPMCNGTGIGATWVDDGDSCYYCKGTGTDPMDDSYNPIAFQVLVTDDTGVVQYEQVFEMRPGFNAYETAVRNAERMRNLFPECKTTIIPLTDKDMKR